MRVSVRIEQLIGPIRRAGAFFALAALSLVVPFGAVRAQGIDATKHDLTGGSIDEICVFCHTPHGANTGIEAPLWNKPATGQTYTTYDSVTIDGDVLTVGSVSIACLTCHDGTQSWDVVINAPGSGGFDPAGIALRGGNRFLDNPEDPTFISPDLTDDHPIGVQYGGFAPGGSNPIDADFKPPSSNPQNPNRWWVDTEGAPNNVRNKTDMILYTRFNANSGADEPFVECASCHDPHSDANPLFLRISNVNSGVCVACHVK